MPTVLWYWFMYVHCTHFKKVEINVFFLMSPWHESVISKNYRSSSLGNINSPPNIQYDKKQRLSKMQSIGKKIANTIYSFNI